MCPGHTLTAGPAGGQEGGKKGNHGRKIVFED